MRRPRPLRSVGSAAGVAVVGVLAAVAVVAPWIAPFDPEQQHLLRRFEGPGREFWLGTDDLGRDTLSRLIFGARVSLRAVVQALVVATAIGVPLGLVSGYVGGWVDRVLMRLVDVLFSLPGIVIAFAAIALLGTGLTPAMIGVGIVFATRYARLVRGSVLVARNELYVDAARVGGASSMRIMVREILPNVSGPLVVQTAVFAGGVVLIEATLSFFGLGAPVNQASWGGMLNASRSLQYQSAWLPVWPGLAITIAVLGFNLVADGARRSASSGGHQLSSTPLTAGRAAARGSDSGSDSGSGREPLTASTREVNEGDQVTTGSTLLVVEDLDVEIDTPTGSRDVVRGAHLRVDVGETVALVGESGSGKTMTALAVLGLLPAAARISGGSIHLGGRELVGCSERERQMVRAHDLSIVFQEPIAALNPALTIGRQLTEPLRVHRGISRREAQREAIDLLGLVGVPDPAARVHDHPHQFSGGMAQRVMIAMALSTEPRVLVADEPTTALDVTVQSQIVDLLRKFQVERDMGLLFITHDLALVADIADRVVVMRDGRVVETTSVGKLFESPESEYAAELVEHARRLDGRSTGASREPSAAADTPSPAGSSPNPPDPTERGRAIEAPA